MKKIITGQANMTHTLYTGVLRKRLQDARLIDWSLQWSDRDTDIWQPDTGIITTWIERENGGYTVFGFAGYTDNDGNLDIENRIDGFLSEPGQYPLKAAYRKCRLLEFAWSLLYPQFTIA